MDLETRSFRHRNTLTTGVVVLVMTIAVFAGVASSDPLEIERGAQTFYGTKVVP